MEVRIRHGKDGQIEAFARFHRVVCDRPFDEGGGDCGMTPPELMLSALGCCAMNHAAEYLRLANLAPSHVELRISADQSGWPLRLSAIDIEVHAPGLASRPRKGLVKAIESCLLRRTLSDPPKLKVDLAAIVAGPSKTKRNLGLAP